MYNEFLTPIYLDYNVCYGMDVYVLCGSIFHVLFPLAHVKKSLIVMCNLNIFNMLCFRTCWSEMTKVGIYYKV